MLKELHTIEFEKGSYTVSTDKSKLDARVIHDFLINSSYLGVWYSINDCAASYREFIVLWGLRRRKARGFCQSDLGSRHVGKSARRFHSGESSRTRVSEMVAGMYHQASPSARVAPVDFGHQRCARIVRPIWF